MPRTALNAVLSAIAILTLTVVTARAQAPAPAAGGQPAVARAAVPPALKK